MLTQRWNDLIATNSDQTAIVNIPTWASRVALDTVGAAAFDYEFGVLQSSDNTLGKARESLLSDTFSSVARADVMRQGVFHYLPSRVLEYINDNMASKKLDRARHTARLADGVAKMLVEEKTEALLKGKGARDIMTLLVKANAAENETFRLSEEELFAQLRSHYHHGRTRDDREHGSVLELARHPEMQTKLRHEIRDMEQTIRNRGDQNFTHSDLDRMPYLVAVLKESLRFHPIAYNAHRRAAQDDIIPLSKPITTASGKVITEIPIPKGLKIIASISGYNRIHSVDADLFNPDRWLDDSVNKSITVGVYGNLLTFWGGNSFAIQELHAFLIELVNNFEFALTPNAQVRREAYLVMVPTLEGQFDQGTLLSLQIKVASREDW